MNERVFDPKNSLVEDGVLDNEWRAFVGEASDYYIKNWESVDTPSKSIGWNWASFLGNLFWMGYRKMYNEAVLTLLLLFSINTVELRFKVNDMIGGLIIWAFLICCGLYGNAIYYNFARRKILKTKSHYTGDDMTKVLNKSGGASWVGVWMMIFITFAFSYVIYQLLPWFGIDKKLF
ncbi:MAG TPA: DUF2628 domain-containing protein [Bacillota bacterium]|nr:DUF2628 domain-containing protein [Bacillota bacterium]